MMVDKEQELTQAAFKIITECDQTGDADDTCYFGAEEIIALVREHDGWVSVPKELTAENGAKGLLIGEFHEAVELQCPECNDICEIDEDCHICNGDGTYFQKVPVSWTTVKEIYAMAVNHFAPPTTEKE